MIVPEKPLWGGNKKICMYVCTNPMNVGRPQKLGFFPKKIPEIVSTIEIVSMVRTEFWMENSRLFPDFF